MSTTGITFDSVSGFGATDEKVTDGILARAIETRVRRGEAAVQAYFARLPDSTLGDLGFNAEQIAHIRKHRSIPASFWK